MGEVKVEIELENFLDWGLARAGYIPEHQVRRAKVQVVADSGARMLSLPQEMVDALGLEVGRTAVVTYADGRREERPIAAGLTVRVENRSALVDCVVLPAHSEPLLGQVVLELTDLLVDCAQQKLVPRPESPDLPLIPIR